MQQPTRIYTDGDWQIEIQSIGQPDPATAAKAILPLILEMWDTQQETKAQTKQQEAA